MPRAFTHNLTSDQRRWFQSNLAVPNPVVLDATGGGGIPFEAGSLGLRTIANELNPVAALILRATCQWPQQHGPALLDEYKAVNDRFLQRVRQLIDDNAVYPPEPDFPQPGAESNEHPENESFANPTVRLHKNDKVTAAALAPEDCQSKMDDIFRECRRVLKSDAGIMTVMFTHKSNAAWNAMTIGLIEAGFNITRAWPVKTEA